jgi:hypothetical protein
MNHLNKYIKKTVNYNYCGHNFNFAVSQSIFSSYSVDKGTNMLLQSLRKTAIKPPLKILDLGCGYGLMGIVLKTIYPKSEVHMVDCDALAIDFSNLNALNNEVVVKCYASLGYDQLRSDGFDLIASNIPAKAGESVVKYFLNEAKYYLSSHGIMAIVVIDAIADFVSKYLTSSEYKIIYQKRTSEYLVIHYQFCEDKLSKPDDSSFKRGIYDREINNFFINNKNINFASVYGLSEFNTLSYETELVTNYLKNMNNMQINKSLVFNPNQGLIPVLLTLTSRVNKLILCDRNLLALLISKRNLTLNMFSENQITIKHQIDLSGSDKSDIDCIIGILEEKEDPVIHNLFLSQAIDQLSPTGTIILASSSTAITRVEKETRLFKSVKIFKRERYKGKSILILKLKDKINFKKPSNNR